MYRKTVNCVVCGKPTKNIMGGHVHRKRETIIATFCSHKCFNKPYRGLHECKGCHGPYKEWMGLSDSGIQLGYIDTTGFHSIDDSVDIPDKDEAK